MQVTAAGSNPVERATKTVLGKDDFLQLLVTQLRNQDPMQPMEDREFIAQLAQFSSLEQMTNMNQSLSNLLEIQLDLQMRTSKLSTATQMIGKSVTVATDGGAKHVKGIVDEVRLTASSVLLSINGQDYPIEDLLSIGS